AKDLMRIWTRGFRAFAIGLALCLWLGSAAGAFAAAATISNQTPGASPAPSLPTLALSAGANPHQTAPDAAGNIFVPQLGSAAVSVIPKTTGSLYGQAVTAGTAVTLAPAT